MLPSQPAQMLSPRCPRNAPLRSLALPLALLLLLFTLSACVIPIPFIPASGTGADARPESDTASGTPLDADMLHDFEDALTTAFAAKDYAALEAMSANPFRLAAWEENNRVVERTELVANLEALYLGPATAPTIDVASDLTVIEAVVGSNPRLLWGEDLAVVSVLLATGLNQGDAGEALLAIAPNAETGALEWTAMMLAVDGFPASPPPDAADEEFDSDSAPISINTITILSSVEVFDAPEAEGEIVGLLSEDRVVEVLGMAADGQWYAIACPASIAAQCWIANNPEAFETSDLPFAPEQEATPAPIVEDPPAAEPPVAETATPNAQAEATLPERIDFTAGPLARTRSGTVSADSSATLLVHLAVGQGFTVDLVSAGNRANFSVTGASNGQPYKPADNPARLWTFTVPVTQDHIVTVFSETETEYILTLLAPPIADQRPTSVPTATPAPTEMAVQPPPPVDSSPLRISFGAGETSAQRGGVVRPSANQRYMLRVVAGQTLSVDLISGGNLANFAISGVADGQPYKRLENEDRAFAFVVPATQDYLITIATLAAADYTLNVVVPRGSVPPATSVPQPAGDPVRLNFAAGETRTAVTEIVTAYGTDAYILRALAGQTMFVTIQSPEDIVSVSVQGADGVLLKNFDDAQAWSGVLPTTQDYVVLVDNPRGVRVRYTLSVGFSALGSVPVATATPAPDYIPPAPSQRINFPPGAISASLEGYIYPGELQSYVLAARAGQRMLVDITSPFNDVGLSIVGADGTPYKRSSVGTSNFSFILPTTQDYFVEAIALGNASPYTLSVTITD